MKNIKCMLLGLIISMTISAQHEIDSVLLSISNNNKSIKAYKQLMSAQKAKFKTGLTLSNPTVEYDYMKGTPVTAGNQTDISAIQNFDFPTTYVKKKQLSNLSIAKLTVLEKDYNQEILLDAKMLYLTLIYLNKCKFQLSNRKRNALQVQRAVQLKFDVGVATILDLNKSKINLITTKRHLQEVQRKILIANQKLTELNGGQAVVIESYSYPFLEKLGTLEQFMSEAIKGDYHLQVIQQDELISQKQIQVNKALAMPKLEGGYRYQTILGQSFSGFHAGISIPLFENKNKVKAARQRTKYFNLLAESHKNEHHNELESLYDKAISLKKSIEDYQVITSSLNNEKLLNTALEVGQISNIEYFMELRYYYGASDDFLELEKDYHMTVCELMKHRL
jgi:cobalt-zinc-cadmium efflux system outer membrane protein